MNFTLLTGSVIYFKWDKTMIGIKEKIIPNKKDEKQIFNIYYKQNYERC